MHSFYFGNNLAINRGEVEIPLAVLQKMCSRLLSQLGLTPGLIFTKVHILKEVKHLTIALTILQCIVVDS